MSQLKLWFFRTFCILSQAKAESMNLTHATDLNESEIKELKCVSLYEDWKGRKYRVEESTSAVGYY